MPSGYSARDRPSRYQPLVALLAAANKDQVILTFKEISAIISHPLADSAILTTGWWTGKHYHHVAQWQAIGWRARVDRDRLRVTFTRVSEG